MYKMEGWMDGRMDGLMDAWMNIKTKCILKQRFNMKL
jgi:hypothetical protein